MPSARLPDLCGFVGKLRAPTETPLAQYLKVFTVGSKFGELGHVHLVVERAVCDTLQC